MKINPYDKRVVDRYVAKGVVSKEELKQRLAKLPDDADAAAWVQLDMDEAEVSSVDADGSEDA
jgi:hypothetical protein